MNGTEFLADTNAIIYLLKGNGMHEALPENANSRVSHQFYGASFIPRNHGTRRKEHSQFY